MNRKAHFKRIICIPVFLVVASASQAAPVIWNGPLISFSKPSGANPSLAASQDRMTPDIWLTRGSSEGLFNAFDESSFTHFSSPAGTEWANGSLANYASLSYTDWNDWAKAINAGPPSTVGVNAVLHLIPDDIYLSIKFTSWSSSGSGGGFSYLRSTSVVPEPSTGLLTLTGLALALILALRRTAFAQGSFELPEVFGQLGCPSHPFSRLLRMFQA